VRTALARRGADAPFDQVTELDRRRRELLPELEGLRARQNAASERIGQAKRAGEDASAAIEEMRQVATSVKELEAELGTVEQQLDSTLASIPNIPDDSAPTEEEVVHEVDHAHKRGRDHLELLGDLVDMESAAEVSGSRFVYLKGSLVFLELALVQFALQLLWERGFTAVVPPVLVRERAMFGTGFLPDTEQQIYRLADDELFLTGTSEVALAGLHMDETVAEGSLPLRYAGLSSCFRREAGAAGKDTRGIFRVHQFDKLEMFSFVAPDESSAEHDRILSIQQQLLTDLGIPYRVVNIAADDLGASAAKKYDLEAWLPGQGQYRELTSCSNTTDYQARRLNARYRPTQGNTSPRYLHTLNGTAIAVGRTIIALAENHQTDDGDIAVPEALHPFGAPQVIAQASSSASS
jgi:seryl-tRNA synthetase